ncbi:Carboxylesterase, partial [Teladorsagia circumcincta]
RVPYAAPPVGELRFQKPQEVQKWDGVWDATAMLFRGRSTQVPIKIAKEKSCPVVFYIHGGGFNYDSAVMFKDEALVNNFGGNGVVLVIPGVRLGFFGLLTFASDDIVPRNLAAYDLLAALQFVQKEIHHFGGNPNNVAIMGHSGGAVASAQFAFSKQIDPHLKIQRQMEDEYQSQGKPEGLIMTKPLFDAEDLQDFLHDPPQRSIMTGSTIHEFDDTYDADEMAIMKLLGIKNRDQITAQYRKDLLGRKLPFYHTTDTQMIFLSSYVVGHSMRAAGGE